MCIRDRRGSDRRGFNDLFFNAAEIKRLFSLMNPVFVPGEGLVVEFISANPGEGVSTLARDFALMASQYVDGRVLLLDFDWRRGEHYHFFQSMAQDDPTIAPGPPLALGVDFGRLLRSSQRSETEERALPLTFHQLGDTSLIVSQPVRDLHDTPRVVNQPDFWADLRRSVMLTVVDLSLIHIFHRSAQHCPVCKMRKRHRPALGSMICAARKRPFSGLEGYSWRMSERCRR